MTTATTTAACTRARAARALYTLQQGLHGHRRVNAEQHESICTSRRRAILDRAANSKLNGSFKLLCEM